MIWSLLVVITYVCFIVIVESKLYCQLEVDDKTLNSICRVKALFFQFDRCCWFGH